MSKSKKPYIRLSGGRIKVFTPDEMTQDDKNIIFSDFYAMMQSPLLKPIIVRYLADSQDEMMDEIKRAIARYSSIPAVSPLRSGGFFDDDFEQLDD